MRWERISIWLVIAVGVVFYIGLILLKNHVQKSLIDMIKRKQFDKFDRNSQKILVKFLFPPYNLEYLRLNRYLISDDKEKIDQQFELLLRSAKQSQKKDIFLKAFEYYAFDGDEVKAKKYYNELIKINKKNISKYITLLYDVFILKKHNHIEELERDFNNLNSNQKKFVAQLLVAQYQNKKDVRKQKFYEKFLLSQNSD